MAFLTRIVEPTSEPVTTGEAQYYLNADDASDVGRSASEKLVVDRLIEQAREAVESFTGRALFTQTWKVGIDGVPSGVDDLDRKAAIGWPLSLNLPVRLGGGSIQWFMPRPPLASVTTITSYDNSADENATVFADTNYRVEIPKQTQGYVVLLPGKTWPTSLRPVDSLIVEFIAGTTVANIPSALVSAILKIVKEGYDHRSNTVQGASISEFPMDAKILMQPYKVIKI